MSPEWFELFCERLKRLIPISLQGKQSSIFVRSSANMSFSFIWLFDIVGTFAITIAQLNGGTVNYLMDRFAGPGK